MFSTRTKARTSPTVVFAAVLMVLAPLAMTGTTVSTAASDYGTVAASEWPLLGDYCTLPDLRRMRRNTTMARM